MAKLDAHLPLIAAAVQRLHQQHAGRGWFEGHELINLLNADHNDHFVLLTFAGMVVGIVGAGVCSVRGLKSWDWLPRG